MAISATTSAVERSGTQRRLGRRTRKVLLVTHIGSAGAWLGIDVAFAVLVFTALSTDDSDVAATSLKAMELFAVWPMFIAGLVCIASGIVLGLGSRYGVLRYWWVLVKLVVSLLMANLIVFSLRPGLGEAAAYGEQLARSGGAGMDTDLLTGLIFPPIVAPSLLLLALVLSVFKPWGRVRRRADRGASPDTV